ADLQQAAATAAGEYRVEPRLQGAFDERLVGGVVEVLGAAEILLAVQLTGVDRRRDVGGDEAAGGATQKVAQGRRPGGGAAHEAGTRRTHALRGPSAAGPWARATMYTGRPLISSKIVAMYSPMRPRNSSWQPPRKVVTSTIDAQPGITSRARKK